MDKYSVSLGTIIKEFNLEVIHEVENINDILISTCDVNRPGLQLAGFFDYFDSRRLQIMGRVESTFMARFTVEKRLESFEKLFSRNISALIVTRGEDIFPEAIIKAKKYNVPILRTNEATSDFMSALIAMLHLELAPRITRHGVLVEVYGEGMLILGESGVGKSETAVELVKRGHRLIADDAVEIKKVSSKTIVGTSPEIIRHFIELRGVGIIDVKNIFGMGAVKDAEKIDMVIHLEPWEKGKQYERLGIDEQYTTILDITVPSLTIPVKPGRNLAVILEIAAMNNRQKRMGYNAAQVLTDRLNQTVFSEERKI